MNPPAALTMRGFKCDHRLHPSMAYAASVFSVTEWGVALLWLSVVLGPLLYAWRTSTSIAMGLTVSVLLGSVVQVFWALLYSWGAVEIWVWYDAVLVPSRAFDLGFVHTMVSAGFLHAQNDLMHVLGNVIILALVGVPLEQRLGRGRYAAVYLIGLIGGSLTWALFNSGSDIPALGASGAAFGLLGAYLSGWPKDEIPFPLILIRPWPVVFIALLYFGLELVRALSVMDSGVSSGVGHMAHIGGFVAAYFALPLVAKGGPYELGVVDGGPSTSTDVARRLQQVKSKMVDLTTIEDPWTAVGLSVPKPVRGAMANLRSDGDEPDTRLAWMEHIAHVASCPTCGAPLGVVERKTGPYLQCSADAGHLEWPTP